MASIPYVCTHNWPWHTVYVESWISTMYWYTKLNFDWRSVLNTFIIWEVPNREMVIRVLCALGGQQRKKTNAHVWFRKWSLNGSLLFTNLFTNDDPCKKGDTTLPTAILDYVDDVYHGVVTNMRMGPKSPKSNLIIMVIALIAADK